MKSRARSMRWREELRLLPEEMRRTIQYHDWKASWWLSRADLRSSEEDAALREGLHAYAVRQAAIQRGLSERATALWHKTKTTVAPLSQRLEDSSAGRDQDGDNSDIYSVDGDALEDDDDGEDDDDDGVQEVEESDAVLAYMELDVQ